MIGTVLMVKGGMMMADRENVIGHLHDCIAASRPENMWVFARKVIIGDAIALLRDQPEVVRCKDCTYRGEINCPQYYRRTELSDDYYCADGERREEHG